MGPFVDIAGYEGRYKIDPEGNIMSLAREIFHSVTGKKISSTKGRLIKHKVSGEYPRVCLIKNGNAKWLSVHKLVAQHFLENPNNCPIIHHKDSNKHNCHVDNLEWTTHSENQKHVYTSGLRKKNGN